MRFDSNQIKKAWKIRKDAAAKFSCKVLEISWGHCIKLAMEDNMQSRHEHKWNLIDGREVKAVVELVLSKKVWADGYEIEVKCCDKKFWIEVDGMGRIGSWIDRDMPGEINGVKFVARCGEMGISQENLNAIDEIVARIESHPEWVAKQASVKKNMKEIAEMEARRKANGYCPKCHSYCHGDCEA